MRLGSFCCRMNLGLVEAGRFQRLQPMLNCSKGESHVVDNHRNSAHPVGARLFRAEHQPQLPANRQLDPYPARNRDNSVLPTDARDNQPVGSRHSV